MSGWPSPHDLQLLTDRFRCHCYEGHEGESCDSINKVKEDDTGWREEEEDEQERKRTEWEDEQDEHWEGQDSAALVNVCSRTQMVLMILLYFLILTRGV